MNVTKDAYLAVKTDKDEIPVFVKIDAAPKTLKAELNSGTGEVVFKVNGTATTNVEGDFFTNSKNKLYIEKTLQYQGATKYWYVPGNEYDTTDKKNIKTIKDLTDDKKNKSPKAYGIKDLKSYYEKYSDFERVLYGTGKYYRDHVIHVFRTWITGIWLLTKNGGEYLNKVSIFENNYLICYAFH